MMVSDNTKSITSNLIHGIEVSSKRLGYFLCPMSMMYQFNNRPPFNPKPLTIFVALSIVASLAALFIIEYILIKKSSDRDLDKSMGFLQAYESLFFRRLFRFYETLRILIHVAVIFISIYHHGSIANVIASNNNFITDKEQSYLGKLSFGVFFFKVICSGVSFLFLGLSIKLSVFTSVGGSLLLLLVNFTVLAPVMFTCYLAAALGKHVENFSKLYIDSLFEQCFKIKNEDSSEYDGRSITYTSMTTEDGDNKEERNCFKGFCCCLNIEMLCKFIGRFWRRIWRSIKETVRFLSARRYPELPEMKMTKISSKVVITDEMRVVNTHLIRLRLRKTQIMLNELRDTVSDINKMSSPIIMMKLLQESTLLVLIATGSIQGKTYKSLNIGIIPTVGETIGLITGVVFICNCLDDTASQLKLMINKLFDFIIMNHRFGSDEGEHKESIMDQSSAILSRISSSSEREDESLSETWSQFQYTRKLANTIQFTIGGILTASRRLVLPILGHVLSGVFIAIEIMSIVDTSKDPKYHPTDGVFDSNHKTVLPNHLHS